jgi:hypothetical protein
MPAAAPAVIERWNFQRVLPNSDGAGIIDQVGDGVTRLNAGQRVWLYNGQRNGRAFGTAAEYITLAEHLVTPLPADISFAAGATLGIPCMTAWCSLFGDGPIAGQTVLVSGGAGAIGHYAVQLAKWGGARVVATVSSSLKAEQGRLAGADFTINYRNEDGVAKAMAFTDQRGVDRVVDVDFGGNIATTLKLMAMNSTITVYATNGNRTPVIPMRDLTERCITLVLFARLRRCWPPPKPTFPNGSPQVPGFTTSPPGSRRRKPPRLISPLKKATSSAPSLSSARAERHTLVVARHERSEMRDRRRGVLRSPDVAALIRATSLTSPA